MVADYGAESALIAYVNEAAKSHWEASTGLSSERPGHIWTKSVHNIQVERFWGEPNTRITKPMIVRAAPGPLRANLVLVAARFVLGELKAARRRARGRRVH